MSKIRTRLFDSYTTAIRKKTVNKPVTGFDSVPLEESKTVNKKTIQCVIDQLEIRSTGTLNRRPTVFLEFQVLETFIVILKIEQIFPDSGSFFLLSGIRFSWTFLVKELFSEKMTKM